MNDVWPEAEKQVKFLQVVVATISSTQGDLSSLTHAFLDQVLSSKLIEEVVTKQIFPLSVDPRKRTAVYLELSKHIVKLMLYGFEILPSKMDLHLERVHSVMASLTKVADNFLTDEIKMDLERLETALKVT